MGWAPRGPRGQWAHDRAGNVLVPCRGVFKRLSAEGGAAVLAGVRDPREHRSPEGSWPLLLFTAGGTQAVFTVVSVVPEKHFFKQKN